MEKVWFLTVRKLSGGELVDSLSQSENISQNIFLHSRNLFNSRNSDEQLESLFFFFSFLTDSQSYIKNSYSYDFCDFYLIFIGDILLASIFPFAQPLSSLHHLTRKCLLTNNFAATLWWMWFLIWILDLIEQDIYGSCRKWRKNCILTKMETFWLVIDIINACYTWNKKWLEIDDPMPLKSCSRIKNVCLLAQLSSGFIVTVTA